MSAYIKSATFAWDYNTIFANDKHQLAFYLDVVATSCFDESGGPQNGGQCDNAPDLSLWDIPLSDSPTLQTFKFRKIVNSQANDLTSFNAIYESEGIYLQHAPTQSNKTAGFPTQKTANEELPSYEKSKRYTFYLTADEITDNAVNICVELDKKDENNSDTVDNPSFSYSNCSSPNTTNNISAISPLDMPLVIQGQSVDTYTVTYQRTETQNELCNENKLGLTGHVIGINIKENNNIENIPTKMLFTKDTTSYPHEYPNVKIHCKSGDYIQHDNKFIDEITTHISRVESRYIEDPHNRNNAVASTSQVTKFITDFQDDAIIFGAYEDEWDGTAAGGAVALKRSDLAEYTSLDGPSAWFTHLLTVRWYYDNNDTAKRFYNPDADATTPPSGNSHSYYIIDSFGNASMPNLTYDDDVINLIDGIDIDSIIPLF